MDPVANRDEQLELAHRLQGVIGRDDLDPEFGQEFQADVSRLCELVIDLNTWRTRGGFDPYMPEMLPAEALLNVAHDSERPLIEGMIERAKALRDAVLL